MKAMLQYIGKHSRRYFHIFSIAFLISLVSSIIHVYSSLIIKKAIESLNIDRNFSIFLHFIVIFLLLNLIVRIFSVFSSFLINFYRRNLIKDMQISLFQKILNINLLDYSKRRLGDYVSRITHDIPSISSILPDSLLDIFKHFVILLGATYIIGRFDSMSVVFTAIFVIIMILISFYGGGIVEQFNFTLRRKLSEVMGALLEPLFNLPIVRAYNMQTHLSDMFKKILNGAIKIQIKMGIFRSVINNLNVILALFMTVVLLLRAGYLHVTYNTISVGTMFALLYLSSMITQSISVIVSGLVSIKTARPAFNRIKEILNLKTEDIGKGGEISSSEINIVNLEFGYTDNNMVLKGINMCIKAGSRIGIVGKSGAGKSTLIKILLGFYRNYSGYIYLGDRELKEVSLKKLRDFITYIPQEDFIFPGTIRDNMVLVKPDATDEEIEEALNKAGLYKYISLLPSGIYTEITDAKFLLSGGERQRLSIARAFLKGGEIFIFDEALGQIDAITEKEIFDATMELVKDKTLIVIAHRISTVARLDKIFVLDSGRIIAEGRHETLINESVFYKKLCELQLIK